MKRLLPSRAARLRHNDYDPYCSNWFGDRSPARNIKTFPAWRKNSWKPLPLVHREMNGTPVRTEHQRCPICHPYNTAEANVLIG
jgi:hypothetical protein